MTRMLDFEDFKREYQKVPVEEYPNNVLDSVPQPIVSVKISTYQHADFIRDCLDGVLMQETDFPIEILIGEDESDDGTREICKEYAERYPDKIRLFLHRRENNIKIHGRPTGKFQSTYTRFKCRGKYIALCEGDDYWTDPKKLQKQVELLQSRENCVLSYHPWVMKRKKGRRREAEKTNNSEEDLSIRRDPLLLTFLYKDVIKEYPKRGLQSMCGDVILRRMLSHHGNECFCSNIKPAVYRRHDGGVYSSQSEFEKRITMSDSLTHALGISKSAKIKRDIKRDISRSVFLALLQYLRSPFIESGPLKIALSALLNMYNEGILLGVLKRVSTITFEKIKNKLAQRRYNAN